MDFTSSNPSHDTPISEQYSAPAATQAALFPPDFRCEQKLMTPEEAALLLANNVRYNRSLKRGHVKYLSQEMAEGRWQLNGEAIRIDVNGELIDGQHRLRACVLSGQPFPTLVQYGLPSEVFKTIDTGARRSSPDVLHIAGYKNSVPLSTGIRFCLALHKNEGNVSLALNEGVMNNNEYLRFADAHPGIKEFLCATKTLRRIVPSQVTTGLRYVLSRIDPDRCMDFFDKVESGSNMEATHPVKVLRDRLMMENSAPRGARLHIRDTMVFVIKSWNSCYTGRSRLQLRWDPSREEFPRIAGYTQGILAY